MVAAFTGASVASLEDEEDVDDDVDELLPDAEGARDEYSDGWPPEDEDKGTRNLIYLH